MPADKDKNQISEQLQNAGGASSQRSQEDAGQRNADAAKATDSSANPPTPELRPDQIVADRYRIKALLARGGMGEVYRVEHVTLRKEYALKTLQPNNVNQSVWLRFKKEADAASLLDHPILVKVHDFGMIDEKQPFFVMDLVEGETLARRLKTRGPLAIDEGINMFIEVCFGLAYAHSQGVVHRDIKPSNVMIADDAAAGQAQIRIVDFGIAKLVNTEQSDSLSLTRTGEIFGTPYYMSPEQCMGTKLDHRSDIYSLGCVMFEAFTGLPPCLGDTALAIMMKHQFEQPPTLKEASLGNEYPEALEKIIAKMIAKQPEDRYQTLLDTAKDLNRVKMGLNVDVQQRTRSNAETPAVAGHMNNRIVAMIALLVAVLAFGIGRLTVTPAPQVVPPGGDRNFYSEIIGKDRLFHFPENPIGAVLHISKNSTFVDKRDNSVLNSSTTEAAGDLLIENFEPIGFAPNANSGEHPDVLKHFRPGELVLIDARVNPYIGDEFLKAVAELPSVYSIDISRNPDITNRGAAYLGKMKNLTALGVSDTTISTDCIVQLPNLLHLKKLRASSTNDGHKIVMAVKDSRVLEQLALRETGLTNEDIRLVSQIKTLKQVDLSANSQVTNLGVKYMTDLPQIEDLSISGWKLTPQCIPYFKKFTNLKKVAIHLDGWTEGDIAQLQAVIPTTRIEYHHLQYSDF